MGDVTDDQLIDDREFLLGLITNESQILNDNRPGQKREVIEILQRLKSVGSRRRGQRLKSVGSRRRGATKVILLDLKPLIEGGPEVTPVMNKSVIVDSYLTFLTRQVRENDGDFEESKHNDDPPEGECPTGWGALVTNGPSPGDSQMELPLLRLQRRP